MIPTFLSSIKKRMAFNPFWHSVSHEPAKHTTIGEYSRMGQAASASLLTVINSLMQSKNNRAFEAGSSST